MTRLIVVTVLLSLGVTEAGAAKKKRRRAPVASAQAQSEASVAAQPSPAPAPKAAEVEQPRGAAEPLAVHEGTPVAAVVETPDLLPKIELGIGVRGFSRRLSFRDDIFQRFHPHSLAGPGMALDVAYYPWRNVGLVLRSDFGAGLTTRDAEGTLYETQAYDAQAGVVTRWALGRLVLGGGVLLGRNHIGLEAEEPVPFSGVVSTTHTYVRPELSGRLRLGAAEVFLGAGYLYRLSSGELETVYFDEVTGGGVSLDAGLSYAISEDWALVAAVDYQRFFLSMQAQPEDRFVVGGALDQSFGVTLGMRFRR